MANMTSSTPADFKASICNNNNNNSIAQQFPQETLEAALCSRELLQEPSSSKTCIYLLRIILLLAGSLRGMQTVDGFFTWCRIIGLLAKSTRGLGTLRVRGLSLVPKPPTRIKAFILLELLLQHPNCVCFSPPGSNPQKVKLQ
jgi:hypothetical protein